MNTLERIINYNVKQYRLTPTETIVFKELLTGKSYREISRDVYKSIWTIRKYSTILFEKFSVEKGGGRVGLLSKVLSGLNDCIG